MRALRHVAPGARALLRSAARLACAAALLVPAAQVLADVAAGEALIEQRRYRAAFEELLPDARSGHPRAQLYVANMYRRGYGVRRDYREAARWYRAAAEQGEPSGMYNYAVHLREGLGVERDAEAASRWFERGARAGHPPSMLNLGLRYHAGRGVERDEVLGYAWVYKAAGKANVAAIRRRNALEKDMSARDIEAGRRLARELP